MAWPTSGGERADTVAPVAVERAAGVMVAAWVARVSAAATELVATFAEMMILAASATSVISSAPTPGKSAARPALKLALACASKLSTVPAIVALITTTGV